MTWQDDMQRDAVRVALPEWELMDDDIIELTFDYDPGNGCDTCGYPPSWRTKLDVHRAVGRKCASVYLHDEDASEFFTKLMQAGSEH